MYEKEINNQNETVEYRGCCKTTMGLHHSVLMNSLLLLLIVPIVYHRWREIFKK